MLPPLLQCVTRNDCPSFFLYISEWASGIIFCWNVCNIAINMKIRLNSFPVCYHLVLSVIHKIYYIISLREKWGTRPLPLLRTRTGRLDIMTIWRNVIYTGILGVMCGHWKFFRTFYRDYPHCTYVHAQRTAGSSREGFGINLTDFNRTSCFRR